MLASALALLIVAPESFRSALEPYCVARSHQLGGVVEFLALESTDRGDGVDAPERLKRELYRRWKDNQLGAVLLVGDADTMPMRFMKLDRATASALDTAFYPSDLYYADLARADGSFDNWNGNQDGMHAQYFGEVHGETNKSDAINFDNISYEPEIAVGRWPVSTPQAAAAVAEKTIRHQNSIESSDTMPRVDLFFSGGWIDNQKAANALVAELTNSSNWRPVAHAYFTPEQPPTHEAMGEALGSHPAAILHTGHGQPQRWEGCLDARLLASAQANATPPLLFSIGCSTTEVCTLPPYQAYADIHGTFHVGTDRGEVFAAFPPQPNPLQRGGCNSSSMAEDAVRSPDSGAIAVIGCVTGAQPCAHTLLDGFVEQMARRPDASIGSWWTGALRHYYSSQRLAQLTPNESWYPPSIFFQGMKFILLGDPTVVLKAQGSAPTSK